ncbi:MAG: hypothetical protein WDO16_04925 [Bacteroidota bacterium]
MRRYYKLREKEGLLQMKCCLGPKKEKESSRSFLSFFKISLFDFSKPLQAKRKRRFTANEMLVRSKREKRAAAAFSLSL